MDLNFNDEQKLLKESVERFVSQRYDYAARAPILASADRCHVPVWEAFAEFGWLALPLAEADGGLGGSLVDVSIVAEGLGRGLVLEPFTSTAVFGATLLTRLGSAGQRAQWLPAVAEGRARLAVAHVEPAHGMGDESCDTRARREGEGWTLDGVKSLVVDGPGAHAWLVSACDEGQRLHWFLVPRDAAGVTEQRIELLDGRLASRLVLAGVRLADDARLAGSGAADAARAALAEAIDRASTAACADLVGGMQVVFDATVAYSKTRVQFGQPIGANQVLKHRMVDMAMQVDEARSIALRAALYCDGAQFDAAERARAVSGACLKIARAGRFVCESAIQLHGAMGMTEELSMGAYLKRAMTFECWPMTSAEHLRRAAGTRAAARAADDRRSALAH